MLKENWKEDSASVNAIIVDDTTYTYGRGCGPVWYGLIEKGIDFVHQTDDANALECIPLIRNQVRGLVMGDVIPALDHGNDHRSLQLLTPLFGQEAAHRFVEEIVSSTEYSSATFLRILSGYLLSQPRLRTTGPLNVLINSANIAKSNAMKTALPMTPGIQIFQAKEKDDPATLKAFLDSLRS